MNVALAHPLALIGLIAAATPIVIYLLLRRRKTEVNWGASYLLRLTLASKKKTSRWKQYVVLAVRCLILALAALLLAQPFRRNPNVSNVAPALPDRPVHRVILADNSTSMTVAEDAKGTTRAARQKFVIESLLRQQRPGDVATLIPLVSDDATASKTLEGQISDADLARALGSLAPRSGSIALQPALANALARLASTPKSAGELYVLSDFPREIVAEIPQTDWFAPALRDREVKIIPVSMTAPDAATSLQNVAIDDLTLGSDLAVAGLPLTLYVDAVNHSDDPMTATFDVRLDDAELRKESVSFTANERKRVAMLITPIASNPSATLKVTVDPSPLSGGASRYLSLALRPSLEVWLNAEDRDPAAAPSDGDLPGSEFLLRALRQRRPEGPGKINVTRIGNTELSAPIPETVDVILLSTPHAPLPPAAIKPLTDFVRRGGGIVFAQMPIVEELSPIALGMPAREKIDPEIFSSIRPEIAAGASRLFEELVNRQGSDLSEARFYNWLRPRNPADVPPDRVVLQLSSGDPLLVRKSLGRGNIYLFTSSLDVTWSSLPVRQSFVPLLARLLQAAAAGRVLPRNVAPGATVLMPWANQSTSSSPTLIDPVTAEHAAHVVAGPTTQFAVADELKDPGLYRFKGADTFTVTGALPESDLRTLPRDDQKQLGDRLGQSIYPNWPAAVAALGPAGATRPLWPWLLVAMLGLYLFETWFVRHL